MQLKHKSNKMHNKNAQQAGQTTAVNTEESAQ